MKLLEMLTYCRPEGSLEQDLFCEKYLDPVFGDPDIHGNYILEVGEGSTLAFMAHHDTVHRMGGFQKVIVSKNGFITSDANCLGADCTTGVWLILEMIEARVPGIYVVHAAEELGCQGSTALVLGNPKWLERIEAAISFDRKGTKSIITHQMGVRTASEKFALSFAEATGMTMEADAGGSYTDSNEYAAVVAECTNISVGYYSQHTNKEEQDFYFAIQLRDALVAADWSKIVIARDPADYKTSWWWDQYSDDDDYYSDPMTDLIKNNPSEVADLLRSYGLSYTSILEELALDDPYFLQEAV
jgi:hypothetical protein